MISAGAVVAGQADDALVLSAATKAAACLPLRPTALCTLGLTLEAHGLHGQAVTMHRAALELLLGGDAGGANHMRQLPGSGWELAVGEETASHGLRVWASGNGGRGETGGVSAVQAARLNLARALLRSGDAASALQVGTNICYPPGDRAFDSPIGGFLSNSGSPRGRPLCR